MLNHFLIVAIVSLISSVQLDAQSAVYYCSNTGTYGFCYNSESEMAARECGYYRCIVNGGTQPVIKDYSSKSGYGALCIGTDYVDTKVIVVAFGYTTRDEADETARQNCEEAGGCKIRVKEQWNDQ